MLEIVGGILLITGFLTRLITILLIVEMLVAMLSTKIPVAIKFYVERANLTMRLMNRRFTRLTLGFSKKIENHVHALALYAFHYNFCKLHKTLRCTPTMAAGVGGKVWGLADMVSLID